MPKNRIVRGCLLLLITTLIGVDNASALSVRCGQDYCGGDLEALVQAYKDGYVRAGYKITKSQILKDSAELWAAYPVDGYLYTFEVRQKFHCKERGMIDQCGSQYETPDGWEAYDANTETRKAYVIEQWEPAEERAQKYIEEEVAKRGYNNCEDSMRHAHESR